MARRSDHSRDELREMALDAAEAMVIEHGAAGLSARRVAVNIGYTVGTLYLVFKNIDDLTLQLNARTLDRLYAYMDQAVSGCEEPGVCIIALGHAYFEFARQHKHLWTLVFEHQLSPHSELPHWFEQKVGQHFQQVENHLAQLLPGSNQQTIKQAARALWGGVHGICILALTGKLDIAGEAPVHALIDSLLSDYLHGLVRQS